MARKLEVDETTLTKMQIRKLNALRRSVGDVIGTEAFAEWYNGRARDTACGAKDRTAAAIAETLMQLIRTGKIKSLPRGGYIVKRGRGRIIVAPND